MTLYPLLFENNFHQTVWGGKRIKPLKGIEADDEPVGESWEVSAVPGAESIVANGPLKGLTLAQITSHFGEQLIGHTAFRMYEGRFPLLVKFIDAEQDLSIQVHPDDEMATRLHGKLGKTEMWYIIDAAPGAKLYAGFKSRISPYEYQKRIEDGSICDVLQEHYVHPGDVFFIPAGRVHAICGGVMVAEVQQSSDVTYRIFDYNRMGLDGKPRELHTTLAAEALNYEVLSDYTTHYTPRRDHRVLLTECPWFTAKLLQLTAPYKRKLLRCDTFIIYMCLDGTCTISLRDKDAAVQNVTIEKGNSVLIPASMAHYDLVPRTKETKLLEVFVDNKNFNKDK